MESIFIILVVLPVCLVASILRPNWFYSLVLFVAPIIPLTFGSTAFRLTIFGKNFLWYDIILLVICLNVAFKGIKGHPVFRGEKAIYIFLLFTLLSALLGILNRNSMSQLLYDIRVPLYFFLATVRFDVLGYQRSAVHIMRLILGGMAIYCLLTLTLLLWPIGHPLSVFIEDDVFFSLGRVSFQQDILFILVVPYCLLKLSKKISRSEQLIYLIILLLYVVKLFVGMSRGLIVFTSLASVFLVFQFRGQKLFISKTFLLRYLKWFLSALILFSIVIITHPKLFQRSVEVNYALSRFTDFSISGNNSFKSDQIDNRVAMWQAGLSNWFTAPVLGNGLGFQFQIQHSEWSGMQVSFIDSSIVTLGVRGGLLLLVTWTLTMITLYSGLLRKKILSVVCNDEYHAMSLFVVLLLFFSPINTTMVVSPVSFIVLLIYSTLINCRYEKNFCMHSDI